MRRVLGVLSLLVGLLAPLVGAVGSAGATEPLPVPYSFLPSAVSAALTGQQVPGANDWNCRPSKAHPRPVVLVHGFLATAPMNWQTYGPLLKNNGYCVFALTYGQVSTDPPLNMIGGIADMRVSAAELGRFVAKVLQATGAKKVDLVGHSQGTLMPNWYVKYLGGAKYVENYIAIAPLWNGTQWGNLPPLSIIRLFDPDFEIPGCGVCTQFTPGSDFLTELHRGGLAAKGVAYTNIVTRYDEFVVPYTSGIVKGMRNIVVQDKCPLDFSDHLQVAASRNASRYVLNVLDPAHARPVTCSLSLPMLWG